MAGPALQELRSFELAVSCAHESCGSVPFSAGDVMTTPELRAFHVGIVVKSLVATMEQYGAMFDVKRWHRAKGRFNGLEMAYGRGGDQAFELFEVTGPGDSHIHQFFDEHGEGLNHIGFWTADVASSAHRAIDAGAQLLSLTADADGNATARLIPAPNVT